MKTKTHLILTALISSNFSACLPLNIDTKRHLSRRALGATDAPPGSIVRTLQDFAYNPQDRKLKLIPNWPMEGTRPDDASRLANEGRLIRAGTLMKIESVFENTNTYSSGFIARIRILSGEHPGKPYEMDELYSYSNSMNLKRVGNTPKLQPFIARLISKGSPPD